MEDVYIKLAITFLAAGIVIYFADKAQKRKIKKAHDDFELFMKARGLSTEIIETKPEEKK